MTASETLYARDPFGPRDCIVHHDREPLTLGGMSDAHGEAIAAGGYDCLLMNWLAYEALLVLVGEGQVERRERPSLWWRGRPCVVVEEMPQGEIIFARWGEYGRGVVRVSWGEQ